MSVPGNSGDATPHTRCRGSVLAVLVFGLCALAFWVRCQFIVIHGGGDYLAWANHSFFGGITPAYLELAAEIVERGGYASITYPPGYPLFIATLKLIGFEDIQHIRYAQAALDSASGIALFLALRWAGLMAPLALLGPLVYAIYPLFAAGSTFVLAESLSPSLLLWCLAALLYAARSGRLLAWSVAGLLTGASSLVRPDFLLLIGVAVLWNIVAVDPAARTRAMVALLLAFALPVGTWGLHNRLQHGVWMFGTTGGGIGLWEGLGDMPNTHGYVVSDIHAGQVLMARGLTPHSPEADRYFKREYWKAWQAHPRHVIEVMLFRWHRILTVSERWSDDASATLQRGFDKYGRWLALAAAALGWRNRNALLLVTAPVVYALFSIGLVHWEPRYVRYVHLGYIAAALVLVSACIGLLRPLRERAGYVTGALLLAGGWLAVSTVLSVHEQRTQADYAATLPAKLARGELRAIASVRDLSWEPVGKSAISVGDADVTVETTPAGSAFQAIARLPTGAAKGLFIEYTLDLGHGGATIGILNRKGRCCLTAHPYYDNPGPHSGRLARRLDGASEVTLVLANNNPKGVSHFVLRELRVYLAD